MSTVRGCRYNLKHLRRYGLLQYKVAARYGAMPCDAFLRVRIAKPKDWTTLVFCPAIIGLNIGNAADVIISIVMWLTWSQSEWNLYPIGAY